MKHQNSLLIPKLAVPLIAIGVSLAGMPTGRSNPIPVTGYTHDVVYEIGATGSGNGTFTNENSALYEEGLDPDPNDGNGSGLPINRTLTDLAGGSFSLAPYNGLNALMVAEGNGLNKFATWTFATEAKVPYDRLSVLCLSAGGQSDFSFVVFFTDGTNTGSGINIEGRTDTRGAFDGNIIPDWFQDGSTSDGIVVSGLGRVDSNNGNGNGVGVRLHQFNFDLTPYAGKSVDHVEIESVGGQGHNRSFLAISGTPHAAADFKIISSQFNFIGDELQLTWTSSATKTYRITSSVDLIDWSLVLASAIPGAAGSTQTSSTVGFTQETSRFFRVEAE